jgi:hypothetical protein
MPVSSAPNLSEVMAYAVNRPGTAEVIGNSLYDFLVYPTAGSTQFAFFQLPVGQGLSASPGNANNSKTFADTNMEAAGQLPAPKSQLVTSIEVYFEGGTVSTANTFTPQRPYSFVAVPTSQVPVSAGALNDASAIYEAGWLDFFVGSKFYLREAKMVRFTPKSKFEVNAALASNSATTGAVAAAWGQPVGRPYVMDPPVLLVPNQNFTVTINFPVVVATPSGFNGRIGIVLDGYNYRNSQ